MSDKPPSSTNIPLLPQVSFAYHPSWFEANARVIEPGPTCGQGRPRMFSIRETPAGSMVLIWGEPATREAYSQECTCGQTPCTYFDNSVSAPMPQRARLEVQRAVREMQEAALASQKHSSKPQ